MKNCISTAKQFLHVKPRSDPLYFKHPAATASSHTPREHLPPHRNGNEQDQSASRMNQERLSWILSRHGKFNSTEQGLHDRNFFMASVGNHDVFVVICKLATYSGNTTSRCLTNQNVEIQEKECKMLPKRERAIVGLTSIPMLAQRWRSLLSHQCHHCSGYHLSCRTPNLQDLSWIFPFCWSFFSTQPNQWFNQVAHRPSMS